jgi:hypothetical protein
MSIKLVGHEVLRKFKDIKLLKVTYDVHGRIGHWFAIEEKDKFYDLDDDVDPFNEFEYRCSEVYFEDPERHAFNVRNDIKYKNFAIVLVQDGIPCFAYSDIEDLQLFVGDYDQCCDESVVYTEMEPTYVDPDKLEQSVKELWREYE